MDLSSLFTTASGGASVPSGCVLPFAGAGVVPAGFLLCNGAAVSRTTYASLYSAIGTTYGVGDESTTFNLPDFRGRFLRGYDGTRSAAIGTAQADGLPEISGSFGTLSSIGVTTDSSNVSGAFTQGSSSTSRPALAVSGTSYRVNFDASASNAIYGNSSYVTPYNYAVQYIIKY